MRRAELRDQDVELQGQRQRAGGVQPRDTARLLRHRQARGRAQLVVRGVEAEAVLPLWALLRPQGLPCGAVLLADLGDYLLPRFLFVQRFY